MEKYQSLHNNSCYINLFLFLENKYVGLVLYSLVVEGELSSLILVVHFQ